MPVTPRRWLEPRLLARLLAGILAGVMAGILAACSTDPARVGLPDEHAPAGQVVEVVGDVRVIRAARPGQPGQPEKNSQASSAAGQGEPLAVGDTITGADVIVTGADGLVTVKLAHNNALWSLGAGKRVRAIDSLAWRAPPGSETRVAQREPTEDHTAAAGRHAEREVASTAATAMAPPAPDEESAPEPTPDEAEPIEDDQEVAVEADQEVAVEADQEVAVEKDRDRSSISRGPTTKKRRATAPPVERARLDESGGRGERAERAEPSSASKPARAPEAARVETVRAAPIVESGASSDNKSAEPAPVASQTRAASPEPGADTTVVLGPTRIDAAASDKKAAPRDTAVRELLSASLAALTRCAGTARARETRVVLTISVGTDGKVTSVTVASGPKAVARCAADVVKKAAAGKQVGAGRFTATQTLIWPAAP